MTCLKETLLSSSFLTVVGIQLIGTLPPPSVLECGDGDREGGRERGREGGREEKTNKQTNKQQQQKTFIAYNKAKFKSSLTCASSVKIRAVFKVSFLPPNSFRLFPINSLCVLYFLHAPLIPLPDKPNKSVWSLPIGLPFLMFYLFQNIPALTYYNMLII